MINEKLKEEFIEAMLENIDQETANKILISFLKKLEEESGHTN